MALDEPREDDARFEIGTHTFVLAPRDRDLVADTGGVRIEFVDSWRGKGFHVSSVRRRGYGC